MLSIRSSPLPAISLTKLTVSCLVLFCTISSKPLYVSPHCITNLSSQSQLFSLKYYFSIFLIKIMSLLFWLKSFNIILKTQNNNKKTCQISVSFLLLSSVIVGIRPWKGLCGFLQCKLEFQSCLSGKKISVKCDGLCPCLPSQELSKPLHNGEKAGEYLTW